MVGEWKIVNMEPCSLPEDVATGFAETLGYLKGASYIPVLYCAEQLVHGTNHMIICKQTLITQQPIEHIVKAVINKPLPTDPDQHWKIVSIDTIL